MSDGSEEREEIADSWVAIAERLTSGLWSFYWGSSDEVEDVVEADDPPYLPEPLAPNNPKLPVYQMRAKATIRRRRE